MKQILSTILLVIIVLVTNGQRIDKSKVKATDSLMKVVVTNVKHSEDIYKVNTRQVNSDNGFYWECRCKDKPPIIGDTLTIVNPVLVDKTYNRKKNFLFH